MLFLRCSCHDTHPDLCARVEGWSPEWLSCDGHRGPLHPPRWKESIGVPEGSLSVQGTLLGAKLKCGHRVKVRRVRRSFLATFPEV